MQRTQWFDRKFTVIEDNGLLPTIIERLVGTPVRINEITKNINTDTLVVKPNGKWSIKEEIGHLSDLEPLWLGRLDDLLNGLPELRVTDLTNQKTTNANHNETALEVLQFRFNQLRAGFVHKLTELRDDQLLNTSLHPRLKTPMRIVDLAYFVAEHDDHHLANIRHILAMAEAKH